MNFDVRFVKGHRSVLWRDSTAYDYQRYTHGECKTHRNGAYLHNYFWFCAFRSEIARRKSTDSDNDNRAIYTALNRRGRPKVYISHASVWTERVAGNFGFQTNLRTRADGNLLGRTSA